MEDISLSRGESIAQYSGGSDFRSPNMKEKILIHLLDYARLDRNTGTFPRETTQKGMAEVINARRSHIAASLRGLIEQGVVDCMTSHVSGEERRQKVYFLTHSGYERAAKALDQLLKTELYVFVEDGSNNEVKSLAEIMSREKKGIFNVLERIDGNIYIAEKGEVKEGEAENNHVLVETMDEDHFATEGTTLKEKEFDQTLEPAEKDEDDGEEEYDADKIRKTGEADIKELSILVFGLILLSISPVFYYISDYDLMGIGMTEACCFIFFIPLFGIILSISSVGSLLKKKEGERAAFLSVSLIIFILMVYLKIIKSIVSRDAAAPEPELYLWMSLIFLPAFMLASLKKTMDIRYRIRIASFIGTFIIMLGLFYSLFPHMATKIFSGSIADSSFLLVGGGALFFYSSLLSHSDSYKKIKYPEVKDLQVSASISGLSLFLFSVLLSQLLEWNLTSIQYTTAVLWLLLFLFLLLVGVSDFFGIEIREFLFILKKGIIAELSAVFIIGGTLLILNGLTAPGIIECIIGLPLAIKSVKELKEEGIRLLWYSTAFIILLELLTVIALL